MSDDGFEPALSRKDKQKLKKAAAKAAAATSSAPDSSSDGVSGALERLALAADASAHEPAEPLDDDLPPFDVIIAESMRPSFPLFDSDRANAGVERKAPGGETAAPAPGPAASAAAPKPGPKPAARSAAPARRFVPDTTVFPVCFMCQKRHDLGDCAAS